MSKPKHNTQLLGRERARIASELRGDGYDFTFIAALLKCQGRNEARTLAARGQRNHAREIEIMLQATPPMTDCGTCKVIREKLKHRNIQHRTLNLE